MTLYVRFTRYGSSEVCQYEGQDEATVRDLLAGLGATDVEVIDEATYNAAVEGQP